MKRRDFIKNSSLLTTGILGVIFPSWSKSIFAWEQPIHNIPEKKNVDPRWIHSLYEKGEKICYRKSKNELKYIGMPVGGLHAGTVYIGGDGRLWLWQIYNTAYDGIQEGIEPKIVQWNNGKEQVKIRPRDGSAYIEPAIADNLRILAQGFAVQIDHNGKKIIKELNEHHWDEITFEPSYPTCVVKYISYDFPLEVELKAFSPFIPLDNDNSSLPLTTLHVKVRNVGSKPFSMVLTGWMENGVHKNRKKYNEVQKIAQIQKIGDAQAFAFSCEGVPDVDKTAGDHGTMSFACLDSGAVGVSQVKNWPIEPDQLLLEHSSSIIPFDNLQVSTFTVKKNLQPAQETSVSYAISWHFNNPHPKLKEYLVDAQQGYWYGQKFKDALSVISYYVEHRAQLDADTLLWEQTWNDSTLPHWFLDRTFVNIGTLATANTMRFGTGRFWGWEGVGACAGTCTHVWQYAQSVGRIFPQLERNLREVTDLGIGFKAENGAIIFRAEYESRPAIDGQAGVVLRFYREHQMSIDSSFLNQNWPRLKQAIQFLLDQDKNDDGMTDNPMENTLDAVWEGEIAWIVGLCLAAVQAGQLMAEEVGDQKFSDICAAYVKKGKENMDNVLFNGEYYIHRPNQEFGRTKLGSYNTCHIDQVYGQAWCFQVNMPRINEREKTRSALKSLWKYNFAMDVGPYITTHLNGRPFALAGEGGLVMNTNPKNEEKPYGDNTSWQLGYFHECMSGFEHQVAAHLLAEDMLDEGLLLTRVIHDRYHASKRNPFNEIECSDHYARAMSSYGTYINACGFSYHGPKKEIGFDPKIKKENFKAAFTSAAGWGSYTQQQRGNDFSCTIQIAYGQLALKICSFAPVGIHKDQLSEFQILKNGILLKIKKVSHEEGKTVIVLTEVQQLKKGDILSFKTI